MVWAPLAITTEMS